jgi:hypothetical protein
MAIEGTESVVDQNPDVSTTTDTQVGDKTTSDGSAGKKAAVPGTQPEKTRDYDREIAGFKADLIKERKARQQYESDLIAARAEVASERKRVQALAGVVPKSDQQVEEDAIKERFAALYPHLADLTEEDIQAIRDQRAVAGNLQETTQLFWQQHNHQVVTNLRENLEKELGGKLSERQMARVIAEYVREAESNPEFLAKHEKGDKSAIADFAKQLTEDWFEPARRKVTQQETQRFRAVPSGKDRGIVTHGEKKIDVTDSKAVEDLLVKGFRERNGEFTGRR